MVQNIVRRRRPRDGVERLQAIAFFEPYTHATGAEVNGNRPGEVFAGPFRDWPLR